MQVCKDLTHWVVSNPEDKSWQWVADRQCEGSQTYTNHVMNYIHSNNSKN